MRRAVFIDRDGVINRNVPRDGKACAPRTLRDFRLLPGVERAVEQLRQAGFLIVIVTNQPDIGNGDVAPETVEAMHARLRARLAPDAIEMCPHGQDAGCDCRKPKPDMLRRAAKRLDIALPSSFMVGDRGSDILAGRTAGCYTVLVRRSANNAAASTGPDAVVGSLPAAVRRILAMSAANGSMNEPAG
jgi:D-glycero-D-manno-heptose 1,7-bisphosphate phosphatase